MKKKTPDIQQLSQKAKRSQLASFRIEGIHISEKRAEEIRREVVAELREERIVI